jgi:hypothetical protein
MSLALKMMSEECEIQFQRSLKIIETVAELCIRLLFVYSRLYGKRKTESESVSVMFSLLRNIKGRIAELLITQEKTD